MWLFFITLNLAMWTNGMAYAVAALSGDHWLLSLNPERDPTPRNWTVWSNISMLFVPIICGPTCIICFTMMIVGLWRDIDSDLEGKEGNKGNRIDEKKEKKKV